MSEVESLWNSPEINANKPQNKLKNCILYSIFCATIHSTSAWTRPMHWAVFASSLCHSGQTFRLRDAQWLPWEPSNIPRQIPGMAIKRNFTLLHSVDTHWTCNEGSTPQINLCLELQNHNTFSLCLDVDIGTITVMSTSCIIGHRWHFAT